MSTPRTARAPQRERPAKEKGVTVRDREQLIRNLVCPCLFFFSSRRRHTRWTGDWSSDVCSSDLSMSAFTFATSPFRPPSPRSVESIIRTSSRISTSSDSARLSGVPCIGRGAMRLLLPGLVDLVNEPLHRLPDLDERRHEPRLCLDLLGHLTHLRGSFHERTVPSKSTTKTRTLSQWSICQRLISACSPTRTWIVQRGSSGATKSVEQAVRVSTSRSAFISSSPGRGGPSTDRSSP